MYAVCLMIFLVLAIIFYQWSRRKTLAAVANMDGPPALPVIGNLHLMLKLTTPEAIFNYIIELGRTYRYPVRLFVGPLVYVFLDDPAQLQAVFNSPHFLDKPRQYEFFNLGHGIFTAPGHVWKGLRRNVNQSYGTGMMGSFAEIFNEKSAILVKILEKYVDRGENDIATDVVKHFLDTIFATTFGMNFDLQRTSLGDEIVEIEDKMLELFTKRSFSPLQYPDFVYKLTKDCKNYLEKCTFLRIFSMRVIEDTERSRAKSDPKPAEEDIMDGKKPQIMFHSLLDLAQKSESFTKEDIIDTLITIIVAGNDTTATTLKVLLLMLAIHQDVQERVHEEIMQACPDKNQFVSVEDVSTLPYTEMVCKETMRIYPVGFFLGRVPSQDIKLDEKHTIPAKTTVFINMFQLYRNPSTWGPDADRFNPDRFLPENCAQRHPYAFIPFGGGVRNCLGKRYAWLSMKIFAVHVLRSYRLKTTLQLDDIKVKPALFLRIANGCPIIVEERCKLTNDVQI